MKTPEAFTSWNPNLYDDKHGFVFKYGEDLVDLLKPQASERILDLGCGTGYLASIIANSGADVVGIDNSIEMITKAKTEYPQLEFQVQSATSFYFEEHFNAIFSNAVLHWIQDKEKVIDCMYRNLKKSGRLVLEMGGRHNVDLIINTLHKCLRKYGFGKNTSVQLWYFPSLSEYATFLESRGFTVTYAVLYNRETKLNDPKNGIKDWIKMFAGAYLQGIDEEVIDAMLDEVQESLKPVLFQNGNWYADYKRLRMIAFK
jgi:trans-aconitate methyltransferase